MQLNTIQDREGSRKRRMRVGRGPGSGKGKTSGRGIKGQKARTGVSIKSFEGGQMPLYRRLPKRGFYNINTKTVQTVTFFQLQRAVDAGKLKAGQKVDAAVLNTIGILHSTKHPVKVLATGNLSTALELHVDAISKSAQASVSKVGGSVTLIPARVPAPQVRKKPTDSKSANQPQAKAKKAKAE